MACERPVDSPVIEAVDVRCFVGAGPMRVEAVRGVSLGVAPGELVAVEGPSGCGKSSLLYAMGLLDQIAGGLIRVGGDVVSGVDPALQAKLRMERIGFVFQFHFLLAEFSALENVMLPMRKRAVLSEAAMREQALDLLEHVGLAGKAARMGNQLSGGERQRVALARALANQPAVLLADEPTGNLDQSNSLKVFELLHSVAREKKTGVLMVTHNKALTQNADRVLTMLDGKLV